MSNDIYQNCKFSLVRFIKDQGLAMSPPISTFVDFDAHAQLDTMPKGDFLGMSGFSMQFDEKHITVFCSVAVVVWDDKDLVRLTQMVNKIVAALKPGNRVPLWDGNDFSDWLVVGNDLAVEPTDRSDQRAIQMVTPRLLGVDP